jgi:hypothetical protein
MLKVLGNNQTLLPALGVGAADSRRAPERVLGRQARHRAVFSFLRIALRHEWPDAARDQGRPWPRSRLNRWRGVHKVSRDRHGY